jgi:hypothetical protein
MAFNAIKAQYEKVYDVVGRTQPDRLAEMVESIVTPDSMRDFFGSFYAMNGSIANDYRKYALNYKSEDDDWEDVFSDQMRHFGLTQTGSRIVDITATTEKFIRGAIESAVSEAVEKGLGVDKTQKLIREYLKDSLGDVGRSRAKMIAQTELIGGSNRASQMGIESTKLDYKKFWSTSALPNVRDSHMDAEADSIARGGLHPDEPFSNGLMFPGDPAGPGEEVINCRCICEYEVL